jgi:3-deoxy-D-manno-octulosonic-acid transferase
MRGLYSVVMWLAQPLLRRKLRRRSQQEPGYGQLVEERFGHYRNAVPLHPGPTVWIHAVSLGETRAAAVLLATLRPSQPGMRLLLTHGTAAPGDADIAAYTRLISSVDGGVRSSEFITIKDFEPQ